jgi:uncharacterized membrane protein YidH (DUF202 family)
MYYIPKWKREKAERQREMLELLILVTMIAGILIIVITYMTLAFNFQNELDRQGDMAYLTSK